LVLVVSSELVVCQYYQLNRPPYWSSSCNIADCGLFGYSQKNSFLNLSKDLYRVGFIISFSIPRKRIGKQFTNTLCDGSVLGCFGDEIELIELRIDDNKRNWNLVIDELYLYSLRQLLVLLCIPPLLGCEVLLDFVCKCMCLLLEFLLVSHLFVF